MKFSSPFFLLVQLEVQAERNMKAERRKRKYAKSRKRGHFTAAAAAMAGTSCAMDGANPHSAATAPPIHFSAMAAADLSPRFAPCSLLRRRSRFQNSIPVFRLTNHSHTHHGGHFLYPLPWKRKPRSPSQRREIGFDRHKY